MTLGEKIREYRKSANLSQEKLAELIGISRQAVTKWETNQSAPSTEHLLRLAEIFGTTLDVFIETGGENKQALAEQLYHIYKTEEEKKLSLKREHRKKNIFASAVIAICYLSTFIICRLIEGVPDQHSITGWLFGAYPSRFYLFGWLIHNGLYLCASVISISSALFGKYYFSFATVTGAISGIILGEIFGPDPGGAAYGQGHYGWAIWIGIFVLSVIVGITMEKFAKGNTPSYLGKLRIICIITAVVVVIIIVAVYYSVPQYPQPGETYNSYAEFALYLEDSVKYILPDENDLPDTDGIFTVYCTSRISKETAGYKISYGIGDKFSVSCMYITPVLNERMASIEENSTHKSVDMQITEKAVSFEINGCRYDIEFDENDTQMSLAAYDIACGIIDKYRQHRVTN